MKVWRRLARIAHYGCKVDYEIKPHNLLVSNDVNASFAAVWRRNLLIFYFEVSATRAHNSQIGCKEILYAVNKHRNVCNMRRILWQQHSV